MPKKFQGNFQARPPAVAVLKTESRVTGPTFLAHIDTNNYYLPRLFIAAPQYLITINLRFSVRWV